MCGLVHAHPTGETHKEEHQTEDLTYDGSVTQLARAGWDKAHIDAPEKPKKDAENHRGS